jgi:hypothetical protein
MDFDAVQRLPWPLPVFNELTGLTVYRPRFGDRRRHFRAMAEAREYEDGYLAFPAPFADDASAAFRAGWCEADRDQRLNDEARAEQGDEE